MATADLAGKSVLLTGASAGIGRAVLEVLVARGASVTAATRSESRTRPLLEELRRRHEGAEVLWLPLDLSDLGSVRRAAEAFLGSGRALHVLINNAAVGGGQGLTRDGFDLITGTNHLGPFLLTDLLLPRLREAPAARIVNVASRASERVRSVDWDAFTRPPRGLFGAFARYSLSKLFNVMHAAELARRLQGTNVTTCSLHPGVIASEIWRDIPAPLRRLVTLFMDTPQKGAEPVLRCALAPELEGVSGRYYDRDGERKPNPLASDQALCTELFRRSQEAIARALKSSVP